MMMMMMIDDDGDGDDDDGNDWRCNPFQLGFLQCGAEPNKERVLENLQDWQSTRYGKEAKNTASN